MSVDFSTITQSELRALAGALGPYVQATIASLFNSPLDASVTLDQALDMASWLHPKMRLYTIMQSSLVLAYDYGHDDWRPWWPRAIIAEALMTTVREKESMRFPRTPKDTPKPLDTKPLTLDDVL